MEQSWKFLSKKNNLGDDFVFAFEESMGIRLAKGDGEVLSHLISKQRAMKSSELQCHV